MALEHWSISSLFLVPSEDTIDEGGESCHCVFNAEIDAVTFVGPADRLDLIGRGIGTLEDLRE